MAWRWIVVCALVVHVGMTGCGVRRRGGAGVDCELASDCAAPLVCRLGACRNECATSGDCAAGLSCVLDQNRLGACQLEDERDCLLDSACPAPLVCRFEQCVNECVTDRDCLGGARCEVSPSGNACIDVSGLSCVLDLDCRAEDETLYCLGGRCRPQCFTNRDCRRERTCNLVTHECVDPSVDGGPPGLDAGPMDDAPIDDAGPVDAAVDGGAALDAPGSGADIVIEYTRAGTITGPLPGLPCTNPSFGFELVSCTTTPFTGPVTITGTPNTSFGFNRVDWTGCDSVTPPGDCNITGPGVVHACFHAGGGCP